MKIRTALFRAVILSATGAAIETVRRRVILAREAQRRRRARRSLFRRTGVAAGALVAAYAVRAVTRA